MCVWAGVCVCWLTGRGNWNCWSSGSSETEHSVGSLFFGLFFWPSWFWAFPIPDIFLALALDIRGCVILAGSVQRSVDDEGLQWTRRVVLNYSQQFQEPTTSIARLLLGFENPIPPYIYIYPYIFIFTDRRQRQSDTSASRSHHIHPQPTEEKMAKIVLICLLSLLACAAG